MIQFITDAGIDEPGLDTGISHAIVRAVGDGRLGETFRIHRTSRIVAFGRHDRVSPGYREAVALARDQGYLPIERLAGGRAAVFHEDTLAFSWAIPSEQPRAEITERFVSVSQLLAGAFGDLGMPAAVGKLEGEYCPGAYSVHVGTGKVMGVGQRLVRGAAHVGGVIVVDGGRRIPHVLSPIYRALGLSWDPRTSGDLADHLPGVTMDAVAHAVRSRLADQHQIRDVGLPGWIIDRGRTLAAGHIAPAA